jgi:hypothetical protein
MSPDRTELPMAIVGCALDPQRLADQADRYGRLGATAVNVDRHAHELIVTFGNTLDHELLHQTISVERDCCTFFTLDYDAYERRLSIGVSDPGQLDALDAVLFALTASRRRES